MSNVLQGIITELAAIDTSMAKIRDLIERSRRGGRPAGYSDDVRDAVLEKLNEGQASPAIARELNLTKGIVLGIKHRHGPPPEHRVRLQQRADEVMALIGENRVRYSDLVKKLSFSRGNLSKILAHLIEQGRVVRFSEGIYGPPNSPEIDIPGGRGHGQKQEREKIVKVAPPAPAPIVKAVHIEKANGAVLSVYTDPAQRETLLTPAQRLMLDAIQEFYSKNHHPAWSELQAKSRIRPTAMSAVLEALEHRGLVTIDEHGIRLAGTKPLDKPPTAPLAAPSEPPAPPKPPSDADRVAAHIASNGVSRASDESPTIDDVIAELRNGGIKVKIGSGPSGTFCKINGQRKWNAELLAAANRLRQQRGLPVWDSRKVRWPRSDGSTEPPKAK